MASMLDKAKEFVADKIAHIPKPEATLADVSVKSFSSKAVTLRSDVAVTNPYNHRLPICEVSYTLKSAGRGSNVIWITNPVQGGSVGYVAGPGWIAAAGEATKLELPVNVPYDFLISLMRDVGRDWDIELDVGLTIDLPVVGNFTIPLSTEGELKLPTLKDGYLLNLNVWSSDNAPIFCL